MNLMIKKFAIQSSAKIIAAFRIFFSCLVLIGFLNANCFSWSSPGHMIVAYIAYKKLKPSVRNRVDKLVEMNPKIDDWRSDLPPNSTDDEKRMMLFMIESIWADQIKTDGEHNQDGTNNGNTPPTDGTATNNIGFSDTAMHKYWHFIDMPFSTDGTDLIDPDTPNALTQIRVFRTVLASNEVDELKAYDLAWLVHVVGDVHQPLHCASRFTSNKPNGDGGGNGLNCSPSCGTLHAFWDGIFGTAADPKKAIPKAISIAKKLNDAPTSSANNLTESDWINESLDIAKKTVYKDPPVKKNKFTITDTYRNAAIFESNKQVALAGARLALILNKELK